MTTTELMLQFSNPETLKNLSFASRVMACLVTTGLGMGITFVALILLQFIISWMERLLAPRRPAVPTATEPTSAATVITREDDNELVAVITAVLANHLRTTSDNIVIKNIVRIEDSTPIWQRAGILEQINSRL